MSEDNKIEKDDLKLNDENDINNSNIDNESTKDITSSFEEKTHTEEDTYIKDNSIYCSQCGRENNSSSKFCIDCGHSLRSIEDNIKNTTKNIKDVINKNETYKNFVNPNASNSSKASWNNKDLVDFIQKNPEYYIPKFEQIQDYQKTTSWNWASFIFGPLWFLYRKMYAFGFGFMVLVFILSYIPLIGWMLPLACSVCYGLFGNYIYLKHIEKNLDELENLNEDARHRIIISKGGVNLALPIIMAFLTSGIFFIVAIFSTMAMFMYY